MLDEMMEEGFEAMKKKLKTEKEGQANLPKSVNYDDDIVTLLKLVNFFKNFVYLNTYLIFY